LITENLLSDAAGEQRWNPGLDNVPDMFYVRHRPLSGWRAAPSGAARRSLKPWTRMRNSRGL